MQGSGLLVYLVFEVAVAEVILLNQTDAPQFLSQYHYNLDCHVHGLLAGWLSRVLFGSVLAVLLIICRAILSALLWDIDTESLFLNTLQLQRAEAINYVGVCFWGFRLGFFAGCVYSCPAGPMGRIVQGFAGFLRFLLICSVGACSSHSTQILYLIFASTALQDPWGTMFVQSHKR